MNKKDEALKMALENICAAKLCEFNSMSSRHEMIRLMDAAITAIREALAEQPAQQEPSVAAAWQQGYDQGVADERTSEANIGIAGFGAKVNPARNNPYSAEQPAQQQDMPKIGCVNHDCDQCKAQQQQEPVAFITPLMEQQMFDDWCPYKGNPDPRTVWAAAIEAVNGLLLGASPPASKLRERNT